LCISLTVFSIAHGTVKSLNELEIDSYEFLKLFDSVFSSGICVISAANVLTSKAAAAYSNH
jgi:hypothetical protein